MLGEFVPTAWHESFHTLCLSFAQDTGPGDFNDLGCAENMCEMEDR